MTIPFTTQSGLHLQSVGDGQRSSAWGLIYDYDNDTYSVSGTLAVPSGPTNYLPPFFKVFPSTTTITLIGIRAMVRSGSCTLSINQNGSAVSGLSSVSVTTTATETDATSPASVASGDDFAPVISAVSSADGLSLTFIFGKSL